MSAFYAVMDIGTNSCRLLIAEIKEKVDIAHVRRLRVTRIGEGLGQGNLQINRGAMDRTLEALAEYRYVIDQFPSPIEKIRLIGTQALREAGNSQVFVDEVKEKTGFSLEIIEGEQEAMLSYTGAVYGLADPALAMPMVLDIGAGSTELIWEEAPEHANTSQNNLNETQLVSGKRHTEIKAVSVPIGSLRLLEKPMDRQGIYAVLCSGLEGLPSVDARQGAGADFNNREQIKNKALIAVAGTATTLGAIYLKLKEYDPDALSALRMTKEQVENMLDMLERMSSAERLVLPGMLPGREDVLPWGLKIMLEVMNYCQKDEVFIRDRDLLFGALYV